MKKLSWPLYHIKPYYKLWEEDGILYIDSMWGNYVLDNKNVKGNSLGTRRLNIQKGYLEDRKLYPLTKAVYSLSELISNGDMPRNYIDSLGELFFYKKGKNRPLKYHRVVNVVVQGSGLLVFLEGIFRPIEVAYIPYEMPKYLGLLYISGDYYLYDLSQEKRKDTWRKI